MTDATSPDGVPGLVRFGTAAARETTARALKIINEMHQGAQVVAGYSKKPGGTAADQQSGSAGTGAPKMQFNRTGQPSRRPDSLRPADADQQDTIGQLIDLFFQVARTLTEAADRLIDVGAGPLESFLSLEPSAQDQLRLVLSANAGQPASGSFWLENTGNAAVRVGLKVINPLANTTQQIPVDHVEFSQPNPQIEAGSIGEVKVTVRIPPDNSAGTYLGLIRSDDAPGLLVILEVNVTSP